MTACGYVQAAAPQKVVDSGAHVPMRTDMQSRVRMLSFRPRRAVPMLMPVQNLIEHMRAEGTNMYDKAMMEIYDLEGKASAIRRRQKASYGGPPGHDFGTFDVSATRSTGQGYAVNRPFKPTSQSDFLWAPHMNLEDFIMGYVRL
ncbi:hypothetical protein AAVH_13284 [Aphelenchoides avenae]|nr:hypothetical protein AAVH_13284 [Aphelenchus avenae]